jgi:hypothetical protein
LPVERLNGGVLLVHGRLQTGDLGLCSGLIGLHLLNGGRLLRYGSCLLMDQSLQGLQRDVIVASLCAVRQRGKDDKRQCQQGEKHTAVDVCLQQMTSFTFFSCSSCYLCRTVGGYNHTVVEAYCVLGLNVKTQKKIKMFFVPDTPEWYKVI